MKKPELSAIAKRMFEDEATKLERLLANAPTHVPDGITSKMRERLAALRKAIKDGTLPPPIGTGRGPKKR